MYMEVPQGFEHHYQEGEIIKLMKTIYGCKQSASRFWRKILEAFYEMDYNRSRTDPCLYFSWTMCGLVIWISWIDDCLCVGEEKAVKMAKEQLKQQFECDDIGEMNEYIGCKVDYSKENRSIKLTQPVLLQSFEDEFDLPSTKNPATPATAGEVLIECEESEELQGAAYTKYRCGTGKLLHMMKRSRPEILNAVRELSKFMTRGAGPKQWKAMLRVMRYCVDTPERGAVFKPTKLFDGTPDFKFEVMGNSDACFATDTDSRKRVTGYSVKLNGAPTVKKSIGQKIVTISVTEAELSAAVECAQEMIFHMNLLESVGLKVEKPMILWVDNKGTVDLINNWSVGGRTRHVETKTWFLRELKENGILRIHWVAGNKNPSDVFTKNLAGPDFERYTREYCGDDKYYHHPSLND